MLLHFIRRQIVNNFFPISTLKIILYSLTSPTPTAKEIL